MTHAPQARPPRRGWCPSVFEPMASGDGLLARVKPPLGRIDAEAARALAAAAETWGNGRLELTNRGAVQVRGLAETTLRPFAEMVLAAGLANPDPAVERRRNLLVSPFAGPAGAALCADLERWVAEDEALAALPAKFGFVIAAPGRDPHPLPGDLRFELAPEGWEIRLDGGALVGLTHAPVSAAQGVVRRFLELSTALSDRPPRMAELVRIGGAALFLGARLEPAARSQASDASGAPAIAGPIGRDFALGAAFGAFTARQLETAATLSERFADGVLRLTPWRAFVLCGATDAAAVAAAADAAGFVAHPGDPRLRLSACAGAPACASAGAPVRADAAVLAAAALPGHVHLAGCPKGCAHPQAAAVTLVAAADGYGLVRNGRAGDPPQARGLTLQDILRHLSETP